MTTLKKNQLFESRFITRLLKSYRSLWLSMPKLGASGLYEELWRKRLDIVRA